MCSIVATHYNDVCSVVLIQYDFLGTEMQLDWYHLTLTKSVLFTLELATPDIYEWLCQWLISKLQSTPTQHIHAVTAIGYVGHYSCHVGRDMCTAWG